MIDRRVRRATARLAVAYAVAWPLAAGAAEIEGVTFAERGVEAGDTELALCSTALFRYRIFIKAYVGALYLPAGARGRSALDDVPKRLELHYFYKIAGDGFGKAADQLLTDNFGAETLAPMRERIDRLHSLYRDVVPGDRYALTYTPGVGTELRHNDEVLGTIEGADFARAYFSIWLGREPLNASFRDQLLDGC